jgi:hypothetical protein
MLFGFLKKNKTELLSDSRRKWLLAAGRWGVVALIAAAVGGLWKRNGVSMVRETCADVEGRIGCRGCVYFDVCGHPKALSAKEIIFKIKS